MCNFCEILSLWKGLINYNLLFHSFFRFFSLSIEFPRTVSTRVYSDDNEANSSHKLLPIRLESSVQNSKIVSHSCLLPCLVTVCATGTAELLQIPIYSFLRRGSGDAGTDLSDDSDRT